MTDIAEIGFKADTSEVKDAHKDLDRLTAAAERVETASEQLAKELRDTRAAFEGYGRGARDAGAATQQAERENQRLIASYRNMRTVVAGVGGALAALGVKAAVGSVLDSISEFETGLVGVGKTTGIAGDELAALGVDITEISGRVPVATTELLALAQSAGQLGVKGSDNIARFTETIAKLGSASDLAGEQAATSFARILTITGTPISEVDRLGASIVALGNNFAATESEIAGAATRVAQATSQFGVGADEVLGIGTALSAIGVEAEAGGTQIGLAFQSINDALRAGGEQMQLLEQITGETSDALRSSFFGGAATEVFEQFVQGLARIQREGGDVASVLTQLDLNGVRAVQVLGTMATRTEVLASALATAESGFEKNIALNEESAAASETYASKLQLVKNEFASITQSGNIGGVTDALDELRAQLADPQTREGLQNLIQGAVNLATWTVKAAAGLAEMTTALGETAAQWQINREEAGWFERYLMAMIPGADLLAVGMAGVQAATDRAGRGLEDLQPAADDWFASLTDINGAVLDGVGPLTALGNELGDVIGPMREVTDEQRRFAEAVRPASQGYTELMASLQAGVSAYAQGQEAVAAWTREQQIASEVAAATEGFTDSERAAVEALIRQLYEGEDALAAYAKAKKSAAKASEEAAIAAAEEARRLEDVLNAAIPGRQAMQEYASSAQVLRDAYARGAISAEVYDAAIVGLTENLQGTSAAAEDVYESLRRAFEPRFGADLSDSLLDVLQSIEQIRDATDGLEVPFNDAISSMLDSIQSFSAAADESAKNSTQLYLNGFSQMASGIAQFAQEGTGAFEEFQRASQIAATAAAIYGIANQAGGDPWTAIPRMIAMAGLMAQLGLNVGLGGGGGSQSSAQDIGRPQFASNTVLGDPSGASESLQNALERLTDIGRADLEYASQMARSLANIETAMAGVSAGFARFATAWGPQELSIGGSVGEVSLTASDTGADLRSTLLELFGDVWNSDEMRQRASEYAEQGRIAEAQAVETILPLIQSFTGNLSEGFVSAIGALGGDTEAALAVFSQIAVPDITLREGDDINAVVSEALNGIADSAVDLASQILGIDLGRFQLVGEGAADTLVRVASGFEVAQAATTDLGVAMVSLDQVASGAEDIGAELIRLSVASAEAGSGVGQLVQNFVGSAEETLEFARTLRDARDSMGLLGFGLADIDSAALRAAGGLEAFTDGLAIFERNFFTEAEQFDFLTDRLTDQLASVGQQLPETREEFRALVQAGIIPLNDALIENAAAYYGVVDPLEEVATSAGQAAQAIDELAGLEERLARARGDDELALLLQRERELAGVTSDAARAMLEQIYAAEDLTRAEDELRATRQSAYDLTTALSITDGLDPLRDALSGLGLSFSALEAAARSGLSGVQNFINGLDEAAQAVLAPFAQDILGLITEGSGTAVDTGYLSYLERAKERESALAKAQQEAERELERQLKDQQRAEEQAHREAMKALEEELKAAENLSDVAAGLRDFGARFREDLIGPQLTLERGLQEYLSTVAAAQSGDLDAAGRIAALGGPLASLAEQQSATREEYEAVLRTIQSGALSAAGALDVPEAQLQALRDQIAQSERQHADRMFVLDVIAGNTAVSAVESAALAGYANPATAPGPLPQLPALIGYPASAPGLSMDQLERRLEQVREDMRAGFQALDNNTRRLAQIVDRWDVDGMPEEREVA